MQKNWREFIGTRVERNLETNMNIDASYERFSLADRSNSINR